MTINDISQDLISLDEIKTALKSRGFHILLLLFSLPIAIPFPYPPGFTSILGIPLIIFSWQMFKGHAHPWLPKSLLKQQIKRSTLTKIVEKVCPIFFKFEPVSKPRLNFIFKGNLRYIYISCILLNALLITLPLLFANSLPALAIISFALGLIKDDGLLIILGFIISLLGWTLAILVVYFGVQIIEYLLNLFF